MELTSIAAPAAVRRSASMAPARLATLESSVESLQRYADPSAPHNSGVNLVVSSSDLDRVLAALMIATGAAAMGSPASLFFTFWGISALRKRKPKARARTFIERMFGWLLPKGSSDLSLSKMHFAGMGTAMMRGRMRQMKVADLDELLEMAEATGVRIHVCTTTMELMGIEMSDLIDYPEIDACGVSNFLDTAFDSKVTMMV